MHKGTQEEVISYSLQGFGDTSGKAYHAVVYLTLQTGRGNHQQLLASKTRVAPLMKQSIPRLELLSGPIQARLVSTVREALHSQNPISNIHLCLDSSAAVYWLKGTREWKQFVQSRVKEILSLRDRGLWNHCAGIENPMDIESQGSLCLN